MSAPGRLSVWKKLLFAAVTTAAAVALLEGLLALAGVDPGGRRGDPLVGFDRTTLFVPDPQDPSRLVTRPAKLPWFNPQQFARRKADGAARVFCLGGSTTYGRPYFDATSYVGQLRQLLSLAEPRRWEVVNVGGVSYASYRLAALCEEIVQYHPDAIVLYTGHNEFLEERTYAPLREMPAWQRQPASLLARTRLYSLLDRALAPGGPTIELPAEVDAQLDHTRGPESYHRDDALREQVRRHFRYNLDRMAALARDCGAPLVLIVPAANLAGMSPLKSQPSVDEGQAVRLRELESQGLDALYRQAPDRAAALLGEAVRLDPRYASANYHLAQALQQLGDVERAEHFYRRALEEDVCPLRAREDLADEVREAARRHGCELIDFRQLVVDDCRDDLGHGCVGDDYFLDHVHPTVTMHGRLAGEIALALSRLELVRADRDDVMAAAEDAGDWAESQLTPVNRAIGLRNLAKVLNWSGKHLEAGERALEALHGLPDDPECRMIAAAFLYEHRRVEEALEHARVAVEQRADLPGARKLYARLLAETERWEDAAQQLLRLTEAEPDDAEAWLLLGTVRVQQQQWAAAARHLRRARKQSPALPGLTLQLAIALHHDGQLQEAESLYRSQLREEPGNSDVLVNLALLLIETDRRTEARRLLQQAVALDGDPGAAELLQSLDAAD